jgi:hypothetical protein
MSETLKSIQPFLPLFGVLIGSFISLFGTWHFNRKSDNRAVRQTAAQLAQYLDQFTNDCSNVVTENMLVKESRGAAGNLIYQIPKLIGYPKEVDLQLVEPVTLSRLLALNLKRQLASDLVEFNHGMDGDPTTHPVHTNQQCGVLGIEAFEIAKALRKNAKLPNPDYEKFHWNISIGLAEQREKALYWQKGNQPR